MDNGLQEIDGAAIPIVPYRKTGYVFVRNDNSKPNDGSSKMMASLLEGMLGSPVLANFVRTKGRYPLQALYTYETLLHVALS